MTEQTISHYHFLDKIGAGGMGEIYLAEDIILGRPVALKILPAEVAKDPERIRRFKQEAKAASALNHPNILTIYEIGQAEDLHFIASEYIKGENLHQRLTRGKLSVDETLAVASQVAAALAVAHKHGIVHRDIKSENIMLSEDGQVKVVDFGLAKLIPKKLPELGSEDLTLGPKTCPGTLIGTVDYMSPEQLNEEEVDGRSDIWSLGICIDEMLTGRSPFLRETCGDTIAAVMRDDIEPLSEEMPAKLNHIIKTALQKERTARYQSIEVLQRDIEDLQLDLKLAREVSNPPRPLPKIMPVVGRKRSYKWAATLGLSLLLAVATVVSTVRYRHYEARRHDAAGREYWKQRVGNNLNKAKEEFELAASYDPGYAQAYSDLADTYVLMEEYLGTPTKETIPKAEEYARKALEIDDSLAETHASLAFILTKLWKWPEAEKEFLRAIELNPKYPKAHQWYSLFLRIEGRYDEALTQIKIAHDLDPSEKLIRVNIVISYLANGENDKAVEEGKHLLDLAPDFWGGRSWLGMSYLQLGAESRVDALSDLEAGVNHSDKSHTLLANLGFGYAVSGETAKATKILGELEELYKQKKATGQDFAKIYAGFGQQQEALQWLEKDYDVRSGDLPHISWHPAFKSLHSNQQFNDLLRRIGLQPRSDKVEQSLKSIASVQGTDGKPSE